MLVANPFCWFCRDGAQISIDMIVVIYDTGMMLRLFMDLYDMEVVDEEVFLKWKEEVNDEYPGKGKALFQVI
jgi:hypothetical protein